MPFLRNGSFQKNFQKFSRTFLTDTRQEKKFATRQNRPFSASLDGVPAVGGLKFSMAQKKSSKKCQLGEVPVGGQGPVGGQNLTLGRTIFFKFCRR